MCVLCATRLNVLSLQAHPPPTHTHTSPCLLEVLFVCLVYYCCRSRAPLSLKPLTMTTHSRLRHPQAHHPLVPVQRLRAHPCRRRRLHPARASAWHVSPAPVVATGYGAALTAVPIKGRADRLCEATQPAEPCMLSEVWTRGSHGGGDMGA